MTVFSSAILTDLTLGADTFPALLSVLFLSHPPLLLCHFLCGVTELSLPLKVILFQRWHNPLLFRNRNIFHTTQGLFQVSDV